jgi:hypothetical protein
LRPVRVFCRELDVHDSLAHIDSSFQGEAIRSRLNDEGEAMVRAIVLYEEEPDAARYEQHAELCRKVPGATFRHGRVFGAPMGEPPYRYYAEWEWPDRDAFKAAARSDEFMATGKDAMDMGGKFTVMFADVD